MLFLCLEVFLHTIGLSGDFERDNSESPAVSDFVAVVSLVLLLSPAQVTHYHGKHKLRPSPDEHAPKSGSKLTRIHTAA